ncbi:polysaccharide biosynthesis protein [uncultured Bacteroides sp.]|uniref:polysaccharide biosynthesis protein n=1 Tax=uncultured Bacteroides sp. TaxID=162156 RepID=UPI002AA901E6|nr:polysaccharide biosynthesis protein [uncultured Bacteroides sp.]
MIDINRFIERNVTFRNGSLFEKDIYANQEKLLDEIEGRSVLVIGGAGTIGSSFIKAILNFKPSKLVVVDISENGLAELSRDLHSSYGMYVPKDFVTYPINYADPVFKKMFRRERGFDIIANFSAHKHVRSEKDEFSVQALLENNLLHACKLLNLMIEIPPRHFFCVSTDKAANPVNIMGGSKKILEDLIFTYSKQLKVSTARFANVAFSNGSLLAGFIERIMKRQPLSAPSDVRRYFVSPQESGQICMLACILGKSGEIFFPKLGRNQMLTFSEIAKRFLSELGYNAYECSSEEEARKMAYEMNPGDVNYPVYFSYSDTTGEKDIEEFYTKEEAISLDEYIALGVVKNGSRRRIKEIETFFSLLNKAFASPYTKKSEIVNIVKAFLVNFYHDEKEKNLDSKM